MAFVARHKLALALVGVGVGVYLWRRKTQPVSCTHPDAFVGPDGKCYRKGLVESVFSELDASDAPVAFDDVGNPLITSPGQL